MANPYSFPTTDEEIWGLILGAPEISSKIPKTNNGLLGSAPAEPPQEAYPGQMNLESLDKQFDVLKKAREIFAPQQTEQPPRQATPQEEKESATEIQNKAVLKASALQPMPQPTDNVPNYLVNQGMAGILANKAAYETAPEGEKGDLIRNQANERANLIRGAYRAAGMPLDQYGADNATSRDMANAMDSQRLRDLFNAIMPDGKYYRSADDYYRDSYYDSLALGYSPRQARKFAANRAKEYQAERVGYLDAVYNNYGRNGYVNNEFAAMILPKIAQDNPMLANFYGNFYAGGKDEYQQQNKLTEKIIDNRNAMEQLIFGADKDLKNTLINIWGNMELAELGGEITKDNATWDSMLKDQSEDYRHKRDRAETLQDRIDTRQQAEQSFYTKLKHATELADILNLGSDQRNYLIAASMGVKLPEGKNGGKTQQDIIKQAEERVKNLETQRKNTLDALNAQSAMLSEDQRAALSDNLEKLTAAINQINAGLGEYFGVQGSLSVADYTGNEASDIEALRGIFGFLANNQNAGAQLTEQSLFNAAREWVNQTEKGKKLSDDEVKALVAKAVAK